uniref:Uncharacterized protein n=1 Tax=Romanomermis culicivorax TaxID=13658 RepID=A0A915IIK0_ROMCU
MDIISLRNMDIIKDELLHKTNNWIKDSGVVVGHPEYSKRPGLKILQTSNFPGNMSAVFRNRVAVGHSEHRTTNSKCASPFSINCLAKSPTRITPFNKRSSMPPSDNFCSSLFTFLLLKRKSTIEKNFA